MGTSTPKRWIASYGAQRPNNQVHWDGVTVFGEL
jgi:hypothetical protein